MPNLKFKKKFVQRIGRFDFWLSVALLAVFHFEYALILFPSLYEAVLGAVSSKRTVLGAMIFVVTWHAYMTWELLLRAKGAETRNFSWRNWAPFAVLAILFNAINIYRDCHPDSPLSGYFNVPDGVLVPVLLMVAVAVGTFLWVFLKSKLKKKAR